MEKKRKPVKKPRMVWQVPCPSCGTRIDMVTINGVTGGQCQKCGTGISLVKEDN